MPRRTRCCRRRPCGVGGVGGVDRLVAQPLVLGDVLAAGSARVEDGLEHRDVQADMALDGGGEVGGGDDGAADGGVGQAAEGGAGAWLGGGDEAGGLAARDGGAGVA